jgi:hypothetical protein
MSLSNLSDPPFACPPDVADLFEAYLRLGNIWKVGELFGMRGSSVHGRLVRAGLWKSPSPGFTDTQIERIKDYYTATPPLLFNLKLLADELGKSKTVVCRKAGKLGLSDKSRPASEIAVATARRPTWQDKPHP